MAIENFTTNFVVAFWVGGRGAQKAATKTAYDGWLPK